MTACLNSRSCIFIGINSADFRIQGEKFKEMNRKNMQKRFLQSINKLYPPLTDEEKPELSFIPIYSYPRKQNSFQNLRVLRISNLRCHRKKVYFYKLKKNKQDPKYEYYVFDKIDKKLVVHIEGKFIYQTLLKKYHSNEHKKQSPHYCSKCQKVYQEEDNDDDEISLASNEEEF